MCVSQIYEPDEGVEGINDAYWTMRAEAVPEDELDVPDGDRVIYLCHVSVNEGKHVRPLFLLKIVVENSSLLCRTQCDRLVSNNCLPSAR